MPYTHTGQSDGERERVFDSLFETHYTSVARFCLRRLGQADAEDAAAEVFAVAWRRLEEAISADTTRAWLLAVAYRVTTNQYRSRNRRTRLADRLFFERSQPEVPDPTNEFAILNSALDALRPSDREILRLAIWDELTHREIAAVIGVKENTVDQRLFRARARLKARFEQLTTDRVASGPREASA